MSEDPLFYGMPVLNLAMGISREAHRGQFRRDGVAPYIFHPVAVMEWLQRQREGEEVLACALLHDVLEDSEETPESLLAAGIPESVVRAVVAMTRGADESYEGYLERVKADAIARKVKLADMIINLADCPTPEQIRKYLLGMNKLLEV